jgi:hypothetical protein
MYFYFKYSNHLLDDIDKNLKKSTRLLSEESTHAVEQRRRQVGFCWMYLVITFEAVLLVTLLYHGLT